MFFPRFFFRSKKTNQVKNSNDSHAQADFDSFLRSTHHGRHDTWIATKLPIYHQSVPMLTFYSRSFSNQVSLKRVDSNDKFVFQLASVVTSGSNDKAIQRVTIFSSFLTSYASTSVQLMIM
jgi:hypothetical protein